MQSQWQPIETAPMTGEAILLYSDLWGISIGRWTNRKTMHGFWQYDGYEGREINFNYWMPLPEPPK